MPGPRFPDLRSIFIYPAAYRARENVIDHLGVVHQREIIRLGESWSNGTVVLPWHAVQSGARNDRDGHNVTLHEFAHQLDQADGRGDGTPRLAHPSHYPAGEPPADRSRNRTQTLPGCRPNLQRFTPILSPNR